MSGVILLPVGKSNNLYIPSDQEKSPMFRSYTQVPSAEISSAWFNNPRVVKICSSWFFLAVMFWEIPNFSTGTPFLFRLKIVERVQNQLRVPFSFFTRYSIS